MHCRFVGRSRGIAIQTANAFAYEMQMQVLEGRNKQLARAAPAFSELSPSWLINTPIHVHSAVPHIDIHTRRLRSRLRPIDTGVIRRSLLLCSSSLRSLSIIARLFVVLCYRRKIVRQDDERHPSAAEYPCDNYNRLLTAKMLALVSRDSRCQ